MRPKSSSAKKPAEQVVKDIRRATRRHFSAEDKIRIVLDGLRGDDSIAELCRKEVTVRPDALVEVWLCAQDVLKVAHKDALKDSHDAGNGVDGGGPPPGLVG
jgi:hypothetical protein